MRILTIRVCLMAHNQYLLWAQENPTLAERTITVQPTVAMLRQIESRGPLNLSGHGKNLSGTVIHQEGDEVTLRGSLEAQSRDYLLRLQCEGWIVASEEILDLYQWN